jgi:hypothetical protein
MRQATRTVVATPVVAGVAVVAATGLQERRLPFGGATGPLARR